MPVLYEEGRRHISVDATDDAGLQVTVVQSVERTVEARYVGGSNPLGDTMESWPSG